MLTLSIVGVECKKSLGFSPQRPYANVEYKCCQVDFIPVFLCGESLPEKLWFACAMVV